MPKVMTIAGLVISILIGVVFAADLFTGFPFKRASLEMDICFLLCALALAYMSWTTKKEQT